MIKPNPMRKRIPHQLAGSFFCFFLIYNFVVIWHCELPSIGIHYPHYTLDFSYGFCSHLLPGAVYNLFVAEPSETTANIYMCILMLLFLGAVSLLLEKLVLSLPEKQQPLCLVLVAFYLTGPATFSPYIYSFGFIDVHWLFFFAPFIPLLQKKWGRLLLPVIPILIVMTNHGAIINWAPFCCLLILYEVTLTLDKSAKKRLMAIFLAAILTSTTTFVYFLTNDKKNAAYTVEEFTQIIEEQGYDPEYFYYQYYIFYDTMNVFDYLKEKDENDTLLALFRNFFGDEEINKDYFPSLAEGRVKRMLNNVANRLMQHLIIKSERELGQTKEELKMLSLLLVLLAPVIYLLYAVLRSKWRAAKGNGLDRFLCLCLLLFFPASAFFPLLGSTDSCRWAMHAFLMLFTLILYMLFREKETVLNVLREKLVRVPRAALLLYFLIYCFSIVSPFTLG